MSRHLDNKRKRIIPIVGLGICGAMGLGIFSSGRAYALGSSVTISEPGALTSGTQDITFDEDEELGLGRYRVPIDFKVTNANNFSIYLYSGNEDGTTDLYGENDSNNRIYALEGNGITTSSFAAGGGLTNNKNAVWAYRAHVGLKSESSIAVQDAFVNATDPNSPEYLLKGVKLESDKDTVINKQSIVDTLSYDGRLTLEFAASANGNLPTDTYGGIVKVAIVAEPEQLTLFDIKYMHQMQTEICAATPTPTAEATVPATSMQELTTAPGYDAYNRISSLVPETELIDKRNNKGYIVRKLADGNCWMAQDLAYAPRANSTLTDTYTDFTESDTKNWVVTSDSIIASCEDTTYATHSSCDPVWGSYYKWEAAALGTTLSNTRTYADRSICPRGWRLPSFDRPQDFQTLARTYGATSYVNGVAFNKFTSAPISLSNSGCFYSKTQPNSVGTSPMMLMGVAFNNSKVGVFHVYVNTIDYGLYSEATSYYPIRCLAR